MQFSTSFIIAAAAFLPLIEAHMKMVVPQPFPDNTDNSPLDASGSNFPCKFPGGVGTKTAAGATFVPGVSNQWTLQGSAVHGGGSCQISVTYDNPPTKDSVFKVVQSYEGGCPMAIAGNNGDNANQAGPSFPVTLPDGLKAGEATFVWTWFNRIGNREMYMNCAPIEIGGSSTSDDVFNGLPDMFVANINGAPKNACTTKENLDIVFPEAGDNVIVNDTGNFGAACEGGPTTPGPSTGNNGGGNGGNNDTPPPAATTAPALVEGPNNGGTAPTSFSEIAQPTVVAPPPAQTTTMMTVTTPVTPEPTVERPPVAQPTGGNNNSSNGGSCDFSSKSIICNSDLTMFAVCYEGNALGDFQMVPPGTLCDTTGRGNFKMGPSARRYARRSSRVHRRNIAHGHSF